MNSHVAVSNLPLPDDCLTMIKSYAYLDETVYQCKLTRKSIHAILRSAVTCYRNELEGYPVSYGVWLFRWFPRSKYQCQTVFCCICGDYQAVTFRGLPDCCRCKCFV